MTVIQTTLSTLTFGLILGATCSWAEDDSCDSLDGTWHNSLGSQMVLTHSEDDSLSGEYITAVESSNGSSGGFHSTLSGVSPYEPGSVFGFGVMWRDGASTTTWTGQCHMCDGRAVLITSWILRSQQGTCQDKWMATRIGQDYFTRDQQTAPQDDTNENTLSLRKRDVLMRTKRAAADPIRPCQNSFEGDWYNELGSKMTLGGNDGVLTGEYRTSDELDTVHTVYGTGNDGDVNTTMSIFVAWPHGKTVTGWNAQCHLCGENNDVETLETVWLMRHDVSSCHDNWKATLHGTNTFTRQHDDNGRHEKLGINTPGQAGEDTGYFVGEQCASHVRSLRVGGVTVLSLMMGLILRKQP